MALPAVFGWSTDIISTFVFQVEPFPSPIALGFFSSPDLSTPDLQMYEAKRKPMDSLPDCHLSLRFLLLSAFLFTLHPGYFVCILWGWVLLREGNGKQVLQLYSLRSKALLECLCVLSLFCSFILSKGFILGHIKYSNFSSQFKMI